MTDPRAHSGDTAVRHPELDLASFTQIFRTKNEARTATRLNASTFRRAEVEGLTLEQADRLAGRAGRHPTEVWPCWSDIAHAAVAVVCAAGGCDASFVPYPSGRGSTRTFCSNTCRARESMRRQRATETGRETNRRYAAAYRAYLAGAS